MENQIAVLMSRLSQRACEWAPTAFLSSRLAAAPEAGKVVAR